MVNVSQFIPDEVRLTLCGGSEGTEYLGSGVGLITSRGELILVVLIVNLSTS